MHSLYTQELYQALEYARSQDQESGKRTMIQMEIDQPMFFQTVFKTFPSIIAERNEDMANLFMDLCFDVACVYKKVFGAMPKFKDDPTWMERQAGLLDKELKPLMEGRFVNDKRSQKMKEDFFKPKANEIAQNALLQFLNEGVDDLAADTQSDDSTVDLTKTMLFVVVRLFTNLYSKPILQ
jgi:hypothetical protein